MTTTSDHPRLTCTAVLRRQPVRVMAGQVASGIAEAYDAYEVICRECGDDPGKDYGEVPPRLQRLRGPYWLVPGLHAYELHLAFHEAFGERRASGRANVARSLVGPRES